jgi:HEAT repeat protein
VQTLLLTWTTLSLVGGGPAAPSDNNEITARPSINVYKGKSARQWGSELQDDSLTVRLKAALALAEFGPDAHSAVRDLAFALHDENALVRGHAASSLGAIGPAASSAVPALIRLLDDTDRSVRLFAAQALGKIGPEARNAVRLLCKQLQDPDVSVRLTAATALGGNRSNRRIDRRTPRRSG